MTDKEQAELLGKVHQIHFIVCWPLPIMLGVIIILVCLYAK